MRRRTFVLLLTAAGGAALALALSSAVGGPKARGARVVHFSVAGRFVGRRLEEAAAVPLGIRPGDRRPLLVFMHGRAGYPGDIFRPGFFATLRSLGSQAPIVVEVNGGHHSYYHDRRSGRWGSYVMREVIPAALTRLPADPRRIAIGGISMGGFGALDLARLHPGRFCAVGGHSPAIWTASRQTAPGAFDGAADFRRHDVYRYARSHRRPYGRRPVWIDYGTRDPFRAYTRQLVRALRSDGANVTSHVWPGRHVAGYWAAHMPSYLRFYAAALARC